jgi:hypothetical protein
MALLRPLVRISSERYSMKPISVLALAISGAAGLLPAATAAQGPVAVIEDVKGDPPDVGFMDYVVAGQVIRLGARDTIVIGYMESCVRERITGGTVTIGRELSDVQSGAVERSQPPCAKGQAELTQQQANQSAAMVFRDAVGQDRSATAPKVTLYSIYPILEAPGGGRLTVSRIDRDGETIEVSVDRSLLVRDLFYDFRSARKALSPGGTYRAALNGRSAIFRIDRDATAGEAAVITRLLRLEPDRQ